MQIILKNDYGELTIGANGGAKLLDITGLGIPEKETQTVTYSGQAGQSTLSIRDMPRVITMSIDFKGNQDTVLKLYRMIYHEVNIIVISGEQRRTITGLCTNPSDVEGIIYHRMYKTALQFVCDDPYFHDLFDTEFSANVRTDKFPNLFDAGTWYVSLPAIATERTNMSGVLNNGIVKIYPIIEIYNNTAETVTGSDTGIIITNHTTNTAVTINRDMKPGEQITVDLPHRKILSSIDGNITNYISDDTVLSAFYLDVGINNIEITNKNSLQDTAAKIRYNNNYEAAVI